MVTSGPLHPCRDPKAHPQGRVDGSYGVWPRDTAWRTEGVGGWGGSFSAAPVDGADPSRPALWSRARPPPPRAAACLAASVHPAALQKCPLRVHVSAWPWLSRTGMAGHPLGAADVSPTHFPLLILAFPGLAGSQHQPRTLQTNSCVLTFEPEPTSRSSLPLPQSRDHQGQPPCPGPCQDLQEPTFSLLLPPRSLLPTKPRQSPPQPPPSRGAPQGALCEVAPTGMPSNQVPPDSRPCPA